MTTRLEQGTETPAGRLRHDALFYDSPDSYVAGVVGFLDAALAAGQPAFVAVPGGNLDAVRAGLGDRAGAVQFADMTQLGRNPSRIIPAIRRFLDEHPGPASFVGEPIWRGRSRPELAEATRHEALLNVAFGADPVAILCPYDLRTLDPAVLADAACTHPDLIGADGRRASDGYREPADFCVPAAWPLDPAPDGAGAVTIDCNELAAVRRIVRARATAAGMPHDRVDDLLLALNEVVTNTCVHTPGDGVLRMWSESGTFVCEVEDAGYVADPLAGRHLPVPGAEGGHGLWLVNQICDLVELRSTPSGTTIRLRLAVA